MFDIPHALLFLVLIGFMRWQGVGFYTSLFGGFAAAVFLSFAWAAAPAYRQHYKVLDTLGAIETGMSRMELKETISKSGWKHITERDIRPLKTDAGRGFRLKYEYPIEITPAVTAVIVFQNDVVAGARR